jgi:hypothetical protein
MVYPNAWKVKKDIPTGNKTFKIGNLHEIFEFANNKLIDSLKKLKYLNVKRRPKLTKIAKIK